MLAALLLGLELVVGAAAIGVTGGFRTAPPPALKQVDPGEAVDAKRWKIAAVRAWHSSKDPSSEYASDGRFLAVELDIEVTTKQSTTWSSEFQRGLRLELPSGFMIDGQEPDSTKYRASSVLSRDLSFAQVHPGLPQRVRAVYKLPAKQPWPSRMELVIYRWEHARGFLDTSLRWWVPLENPEVARVVLPVGDGPP